MMSSAIQVEDLAELHALETLAGAASLVEYIPRITPRWVEPTHLTPIAELFAEAEVQPVRATVSVPPRHGKTELLIHAIPWWLERHPLDTLGYVSYAADIAHRKSKRSLDLARNAGLPLRSDIASANEWRVIGDGGLIATGIGGPLTGEGVKVLIIDDPVKNREEAESATIRQKTWEWFTSTALTRLDPGGSCIVVHTRWHADDLIGRLKQKDQTDDIGKWTHVNLPALDEGGNALWPDRWPEDLLRLRKSDVGEYDWWSLFMGSPRPRGGKLFRDATFYGRFPDLEGAYILIICDPAATSSTRADYSAITVGAGKLNSKGLPQIDILEVHRLQVEIPVLVQYLLELQKKWAAPIGVEAVGGFKAVPQMLRSVNPSLRVFELAATTDKFVRALPAAAAWNDGRIRCPAQASWLAPFLSELSSFTGISDAEDDQVDALAHMYAEFNRMLTRRRVNANEINLPFG